MRVTTLVREQDWFEGGRKLVATTINRCAEDLVSWQPGEKDLEAHGHLAICSGILGTAFEDHAPAWSSLLRSGLNGASFRDVLDALFEPHMPAPVGLVMCNALARNGRTVVEKTIGRFLTSHGEECRLIGLPRLLWVAVIRGCEVLDVEVRSRSDFGRSYPLLLRVIQLSAT